MSGPIVLDSLQGTLIILVAGVLGTYMWRFLGVAVANRLDENSPWIGWVRAVATALVAGLIARLIFFPPGSLALTPLWLRLMSAGAAAGYFYTVHRHLWWALAVGEAVFVIGWLVSMGG